MIALLLSSFLLSQVCDANALYPTTEPTGGGGGTGVPSGVKFCYDEPTNSVCHYESGGSMFGESNSATYTWDGKQFCLDAPCNAAIEIEGSNLDFVSQGFNRFGITSTRLRSLDASGPFMAFDGAGAITTSTFTPNAQDTNTGISGDGADTLGLLAGGTAATWDGTHFDLNPAGSRAGISYEGANQLRFYAAGALRGFISNIGYSAGSGGAAAKILNESPSLTNASLIPSGTDITVGVGGDGVGAVSLVGEVVYPTSATQTLADGTGQIDPDAKTIHVAGSGGAVTLAATSILAGKADQEIKIIGTSDTNTVEVLHSSAVQLAGGVDFTLGSGDVLSLTNSSVVGAWVENYRSNNNP